MDNLKIRLGVNRFGKCLIADADIAKDELLVEFDGQVYEADKCSDLPQDVADHAIQFEEHKWRDSDGIARYINHSCEPNSGVRGDFTLVAMRDIVQGEELTWDYDMTEDSDWRMQCECGSIRCRGTIGSFSLVSEDVRKKYKGYIGRWLSDKYNLN